MFNGMRLVRQNTLKISALCMPRIFTVKIKLMTARLPNITRGIPLRSTVSQLEKMKPDKLYLRRVFSKVLYPKNRMPLTCYKCVFVSQECYATRLAKLPI